MALCYDEDLLSVVRDIELHWNVSGCYRYSNCWN